MTPSFSFRDLLLLGSYREKEVDATLPPMIIRKRWQRMWFVPRIKVSTQAKNIFVEVRHTDNGTGIPTDKQNRIFDPFPPASLEKEQHRLGLVNYDVVVTEHEGEISVESQLNRFTTVIMKIPIL